MKVAFEPAVTPSIQAGAGAYGRGRKVAITATPDAPGFPVVWDVELYGSRGWRFPPCGESRYVLRDGEVGEDGGPDSKRACIDDREPSLLRSGTRQKLRKGKKYKANHDCDRRVKLRRVKRTVKQTKQYAH